MKVFSKFFTVVRTAKGNFVAWTKKVAVLREGHWRWAALGVLLITAVLMLGLIVEMTGVYHVTVMLGAIVFFFALAYLSGLGARLGLTLLSLLPRKQNWIFFGGVFFLMFLFDSAKQAFPLFIIFLLLSGSFLGAGMYNLTGGRWSELDLSRRVLTLVFLLLGSSMILFAAIFLLYPGKAPEEVKIRALESTHLPEPLAVQDPSLPGPFAVDSLTYGWGKDRRAEFGENADLISGTVDGSNYLSGWEKFSGKMRTRYWKMGPDSLALNGRVWYPEGDGPFPLLLMVHGNHDDRDFSDPGYAYLGRHFASHGIISVSVDENFLNGAWSDIPKGLNTENDCRGWLLLKHLEQWRQWSSTDSCFFFGKADLDNVILMGHSRGGEAVSIAACFNQLPYYPDNSDELFDFQFGIRGIAAIAPVDGQYWPAGVETPVKGVNYFTLHGSMDSDMRTFDGVRQMRRVQFVGDEHQFAAGLYIHGANHGQFNTSWGKYDNGYPRNMFLNRKAIIAPEKQEKVALVYLTAFVKESLESGSGYLSIFKDARSGRNWLPELVYLNQFHESTALIICEYDEDINLNTGTLEGLYLEGKELATWKEGRIPKKWGNMRNNGVFLGWNNEKDSLPGTYVICMDSLELPGLDSARYLSFLVADAQSDPGQRLAHENGGDGDANENGGNENAKDGEADEDRAEEEAGGKEGNEEDSNDGEIEGNGEEEEDEEESVDCHIVLVDREGVEHRQRMGDYRMIQAPLKPSIFKSSMFTKDPDSEVMLEYVAIPMESFGMEAGNIRKIIFEFDTSEKGMIILDQLGFSY